MTSIFTKLATTVFAGYDAAGKARTISTADAQRWGAEVEASLSSLSADVASAAQSHADVESDIADLSSRIENVYENQGAGGLVFTSKANLDAALGYDANQRAEVRGDSDSANDGIYQKTGASDAGSWTRISDLPDASIEANVRTSVQSDVQGVQVDYLKSARQWKQYPLAGEKAVPNGGATSMTFTRPTVQFKTSALGLLKVEVEDTPADDFDPANGNYLGWLIEPPRTNLALFSDALDNAYWQVTRGAITPDPSVIDPRGNTRAEKFTETAENGAHGINTDYTISVAVGDYVTASGFFKAAERDEVAVDLASSGNGEFTQNPTVRAKLVGDGSILSNDALDGGVEAYPNGWYRVWCVGKVAVAGTVRALFTTSLDDQGGFVGEAGKGLYMTALQVENGYNPTSYIKTTSESVSRGAIGINRAWGDAAQGTLFVRFSLKRVVDADGTARIFGIYKDSDNRLHVSLNENRVLSLGMVLGAGNGATFVGPTIELGEEVWAAVSWKDGEQHLAVNGNLYEDTSIASAFSGLATLVAGSRTGDGTSEVPNVDLLEFFGFPRFTAAGDLTNMSDPNFSGMGMAPAELTEVERRAWAGNVQETSFAAFSDLQSTNDAQLVVAKNPEMWNPVFEHVVETPVTTDGAVETYHSLIQTATGLQRNTEYWWQYRQNGNLVGVPRRVKTAPATGLPASFSFSVVSCSDVTRSTVHDIFLALAAEGVDFVHHIGDITYPGVDTDIREASIGRHRDELVRQFLSGPSASKLFQSTALGIYIPDNHDGNGGQWGTQYESGATFQQLNTLTRQAYRETTPHFQFEQDRLGINNASPDTVTLTQRMDRGRVRFICPDLISQWNTGTPDTHFGADYGYEYWNQRQWFYDQLDEAEADPNIALIVFLCSDTWHGAELSWQITHPTEWAAVRDYIDANVTKKFLLICGDGHAGGLDDGSTYGASFPMVMSSGLYQPKNGSKWNVGPFSYQDADSGIFDVGTIYLYTVFDVIDNGGTDISIKARFRTAPVDADTKQPTDRGDYTV